MGGGGFKRLNPSKIGFTLAEVLITLAIIGIVAALTIPALVAEHQKSQFYTSFMKTYNTLVNIVRLSTIDNGNPPWKTDEANFEDFVSTHVLPYVKYSKYGDDAYNLSRPFKDLGGTEIAPISALPGNFFDLVSKPILLNDGAVIWIAANGGGDYIVTFADTNGDKGPNTFGRDIFMFERFGDENSGIKIYTYDNNDCCNGASTSAEDCPFAGYACTYRLIKDGKMNY